MMNMMLMIRHYAVCLVLLLLFASLPGAVSAGMIRDTELESGLQKLMALLPLQHNHDNQALTRPEILFSLLYA